MDASVIPPPPVPKPATASTMESPLSLSVSSVPAKGGRWTLVTTILVTSLVLVLVLTVLFWATPLGKSDQLGLYIGTLGAVGLVVAVVSIVVGIRIADDQRRRSQVTDEVALDQVSWSNLERRFLEQPGLVRLYKQMYADNPVVQQLVDPDPPPASTSNDPALPTATEIHMANILFQVIENVNAASPLTAHGWDDLAAWLAVFRSWLRSPILLRQWQMNKSLFGDATIAFVDNNIIGH